MNEIIKMLDNNLEYIEHKICEDIIYIKVKSTRKEVICPYSNTMSNKLHSYYKKSFAETFDFLSPNAKKTKRLEKEIINVSMNLSSTVASKILSENVVNISKSTICELLKKRDTNN